MPPSSLHIPAPHTPFLLNPRSTPLYPPFPIEYTRSMCSAPSSLYIPAPHIPFTNKPQTNSPKEVQAMIAHTTSYTEEVLESCGEAVDRRWVS